MNNLDQIKNTIAQKISPLARTINSGVNGIAGDAANAFGGIKNKVMNSMIPQAKASGSSYIPVNENYYTQSNPAMRGRSSAVPTQDSNAAAFEQVTMPFGNTSRNPYYGDTAHGSNNNLGFPSDDRNTFMGNEQSPVLPLVNDQSLNNYYDAFVQQPNQGFEKTRADRGVSFRDAAERKTYADFMKNAYTNGRGQALSNWQNNPYTNNSQWQLNQ